MVAYSAEFAQAKDEMSKSEIVDSANRCIGDAISPDISHDCSESCNNGCNQGIVATEHANSDSWRTNSFWDDRAIGEVVDTLVAPVCPTLVAVPIDGVRAPSCDVT